MFVIRWILGRIILLANFIFPGKKRQRPVAEQAKIDEQTNGLAFTNTRHVHFASKYAVRFADKV